ncbi:unnamed protein product [Sphacelaria rigidula]
MLTIVRITVIRGTTDCRPVSIPSILGGVDYGEVVGRRKGRLYASRRGYSHDLACRSHMTVDLVSLQSGVGAHRVFAGPGSQSMIKHEAPSRAFDGGGVPLRCRR